MRRSPKTFKTVRMENAIDHLPNLKIIVFAEQQGETMREGSFYSASILKKRIAFNVGVGWQAVEIAPDGLDLNLRGYTHDEVKEVVKNGLLMVDADEYDKLDKVELAICIINPPMTGEVN